MKIWHVGAESCLNNVNGLNAVVWNIAKEQAHLGHKVVIILNSQPDETALIVAKKTGIELVHIPIKRWLYNSKTLKYLLDSNAPQIVHMHGVFLPKQALLALKLARKKIPYIITPHGGINLLRSKIKKIIYIFLIERHRFYKSSAITTVTPMKELIQTFIPHYNKIIRWIPNPICINKSEWSKWKENIKSKNLVFLGRFDVLHKGIDILIEIARLLPEFKFHLYGSKEQKTSRLFDKLIIDKPNNICFHKPIFGNTKSRILSEASLYIQTSRWEGFPISVAEAMYLGVPCAISGMPKYSKIFNQYNLGLVLSMNPKKAAAHLRKTFTQPELLQNWSKRAEAFAQKHFNPHKVALEYLRLYEEVIYKKFYKES